MHRPLQRRDRDKCLRVCGEDQKTPRRDDSPTEAGMNSGRTSNTYFGVCQSPMDRVMKTPRAVRKCTKCGQIKPLTRNFWYVNRGYYHPPCIECRRERARTHQASKRAERKIAPQLRYLEYEAAKRNLLQLSLTPEEYEAHIRRLAQRLGT